MYSDHFQIASQSEQIFPKGNGPKMNHTARRRLLARSEPGVVQLPTLVVCDQLADSSLVKQISEWAPRREIIHAVFSSGRRQMPAVRALLDYLAERYQQMDED